MLHEFAAIVNCALAPGAIAGKQLKPYMDFLGGPPRTIYRNWDPIAGNYALGGQTARLIAAPRYSAEVIPDRVGESPTGHEGR